MLLGLKRVSFPVTAARKGWAGGGGREGGRLPLVATVLDRCRSVLIIKLCLCLGSGVADVTTSRLIASGLMSMSVEFSV